MTNFLKQLLDLLSLRTGMKKVFFPSFPFPFLLVLSKLLKDLRPFFFVSFILPRDLPNWFPNKVGSV